MIGLLIFYFFYKHCDVCNCVSAISNIDEYGWNIFPGIFPGNSNVP